MGKIALAIHGGAGTIAPELMTPTREKAYREALDLSLRKGYGVLLEGGAALDAVEAAVRVLEDSPLFNAGRGSVFNADGQHEMDASLMNGSDLQAGAVAGVQNVKNPNSHTSIKYLWRTINTSSMSSVTSSGRRPWVLMCTSWTMLQVRLQRRRSSARWERWRWTRTAIWLRPRAPAG